MQSLNDYAFNEYSQNGEDGIISKIFELIGVDSKICIEVGAWDGFYLSNTAKLWSEDGWEAILIEGNAEKAEELRKNARQFNCQVINKFVGLGKDSLEFILNENHVPFNVDLLSIDIDGDDYYIFESLKELRPRVIVVEYNPTIPWDLDIYADKGNYFGASVTALMRIGKAKGYKLASVTDTNLIFILAAEMDKLNELDTDPCHMVHNKYVNYIITSYAGEYLVCGQFIYSLNFRCNTFLNGDSKFLKMIDDGRTKIIFQTDKPKLCIKQLLRWLLGRLCIKI